MSDNLKISPAIAEICGIITGDGHLSRYISSKRSDYMIEIVGHKKEDIEYFKYVSSLFRKSFNKDLKLKIESDYARLYTHSKKILEFFEDIGLIVGKKSGNACIPKKILDHQSLSLNFLRGLADTDFSMSFKKGGRKNNSYPRIIAEFASENLIEDIQVILKRIRVTYYKQKVIRKNSWGTFVHHRLEVNGKKNLKKWLNFVGFSNPKHMTKVEVWEKLGYCPPRTTYTERLKIMEAGETSPAS